MGNGLADAVAQGDQPLDDLGIVHGLAGLTRLSQAVADGQADQPGTSHAIGRRKGKRTRAAAKSIVMTPAAIGVVAVLVTAHDQVQAAFRPLFIVLCSPQGQDGELSVREL
jgi:hypothetical protein